MLGLFLDCFLYHHYHHHHRHHHYLRQCLSLNGSRIQLYWMARELQVLHFPSAAITGMCRSAWLFNVGPGDPGSHPPAFMADTLPVKASLHALNSVQILDFLLFC